MNKDEFRKGRDTEISKKEYETLIADLNDSYDKWVTNSNNTITKEQEEQKQQIQKAKKKRTSDNSFPTANNTSVSLKKLLIIQYKVPLIFKIKKFIYLRCYLVMNHQSQMNRKFLMGLLQISIVCSQFK